MSQRQNQVVTFLVVIALLLSATNTYLIYEHIDSQKKRDSEQNQRLKEIQEAINRTQESLTTLESGLSTNWEAVSELETNLRDEVAGLGDEIDANRLTLEDTASAIGKISDEITALSTSLSYEMQGNLSLLQSEVAELESRLAEYQNRTPARVYERARKSVVIITTLQKQGSGFMWFNRSFLLTNWHVVNETDTVNVGYHDGTWGNATVIGSDPYSDIAVLRVQDPPSDVMPLETTDSSLLWIGQEAIAIGNPLGSSGSLSSGYISQVIERLDLPPLIVPVIQLDVTIAPGSSGGPLLDLDGRVIGITNAGTLYGINFAVMSNIVERVATTIVDEGEYTHPLFGFYGVLLTPSLIEGYNVINIEATQNGILILDLMEDYPADEAGLQPGEETFDTQGRPGYRAMDIIVAIDGMPIRTWGDWDGYIAEKISPDQEVTLTIWRSGEMIEVPLVTAKRPPYGE
ncbi:MAG TPA: trypsin-like peptidase domain-containing protein [Patescibacteria group bacterium]|nr:trypsin-like peptidase domain-containing protein [Patescibacteria group bacterium]